jgi:hypothetical protein
VRSLRASRVAAFTLCFALATPVLPVLAYRALERAGVEYTPIRLNMADDLAPRLANLERHRGRPGVVQVAVLGDSTSVSYPDGRRIYERLYQQANRLAEGRPHIRVVNLGSHGASPFDYYFLADRIAEAGPDQVVIGFNLASMGPAWRQSLARPELGGFVRPGRLGEAFRMPLHWVGLNADELLFYRAIIGAGGYDPWRRLQQEQVRLGSARAKVESWVGERTGAHPEVAFQRALKRARRARDLTGGANRYKARALLRHYGPALAGADPDHPVLRVFAATVSLFERSGIRTLVYVVPLNVEHLDAVGIFDAAGMAKTLASLGAAVRKAGGRFVDLHDLFPDQGFRDAPGHFTVEGPIDGPAQVAAALAPIVVAEARRSPVAGR